MDAFSYSFCRQFITNRDESIVEYNQDDACLLQDDRRELSLSSIPIHQYSREELKILSNAVGKSNALYLETEGVVGLNWDDILECDLDEVCVTVKSTRALENIAEAQLENLTEIVLEDMFESRSNDAKNYPRDLNNNGIDNGHVNDSGLRTLLFDLASEENGTDSCHRLTQRRRPLERLNLPGNTINSGTLTALSMFTSLKSLKVLILVGCQIKGDGLMELLGHSSLLKELYIASNIIGDSGILSLAQSIKEQRLPYLKVLHMKSNVFSVNAFREFVNDGLAHSKRLESVEVSNTGAITSSQQDHWNILEQMMQHYLLLNQAGRFTLFVDHCSAEKEGKDTNIKSVSTNNICDNKIPTNLWPIILEDADLVYGADALYYFLHKRPDLIISSQHSQSENNCQKLAYNNTLPQTTSPKSVTDIAAYPSLSNYTNT